MCCISVRQFNSNHSNINQFSRDLGITKLLKVCWVWSKIEVSKEKTHEDINSKDRSLSLIFINFLKQNKSFSLKH